MTNADIASFVETEIRENVILVRPLGAMDENMDMSKAVEILTSAEATAKEIHFDLGKISKINSCGVREWLLFLEKIQKDHVCRFLVVNEAFVSEANNAINMFGKKGTVVEKFEAPYYCQNCDLRITPVLSREDIRKADDSIQLPSIKCESCQGEMEFDELVDEYFDFLKSH